MIAPQEDTSAEGNVDDTRSEGPNLGDRLLYLLNEAREAKKLGEDRVPFDTLLAGAQGEQISHKSSKKEEAFHTNHDGIPKTSTRLPAQAATPFKIPEAVAIASPSSPSTCLNPNASA